MNAPAATAPPIRLDWPAAGVSRVPYRVYTDPDLYGLEQQRIFRGPAWNFLGLAVQVPNAGDFKAAFVGDTPAEPSGSLISEGNIRAFWQVYRQVLGL